MMIEVEREEGKMKGKEDVLCEALMATTLALRSARRLARSLRRKGPAAGRPCCTMFIVTSTLIVCLPSGSFMLKLKMNTTYNIVYLASLNWNLKSQS
jgi:hypothetical protein